MSDQRPFVYISSPYTLGDVAANTRFQMAVFDKLIGWDLVWPVAPLWSHFQHLSFPRPYADWMAYDLALIERMDACLRLAAEMPGYTQSESAGADAEVDRFKELGKPVFTDYWALYSWAEAWRPTSGDCNPGGP